MLCWVNVFLIRILESENEEIFLMKWDSFLQIANFI